MTRTQTRAYGVSNPSSRQLLLEAMLRVFAWLVSNVVSLFGMIINRITRDWHTGRAEEVQLPTSNDITEKDTQLPQPSFSGKRKARIPRIPVVSTQGTTPYSPEAYNQDARHKAAHGTLSVAPPFALSFRAQARSAADPEPRGDAHRQHTKLLASGSRALRASGMTSLVCSGLVCSGMCAPSA